MGVCNAWPIRQIFGFIETTKILFYQQKYETIITERTYIYLNYKSTTTISRQNERISWIFPKGKGGFRAPSSFTQCIYFRFLFSFHFALNFFYQSILSLANIIISLYLYLFADISTQKEIYSGNNSVFIA